MVLLHEELLEDLEVYGGPAKEVKPRCQLWASMSRTGFVNAVSEDGRSRLRVLVAIRLREDHVEGILNGAR